MSHNGDTDCHRENGEEYIQSFPIFNCIYYQGGGRGFVKEEERNATCTSYVENRAVDKLALSWGFLVPAALSCWPTGQSAEATVFWAGDHCSRLCALHKAMAVTTSSVVS